MLRVGSRPSRHIADRPHTTERACVGSDEERLGFVRNVDAGRCRPCPLDLFKHLINDGNKRGKSCDLSSYPVGQSRLVVGWVTAPHRRSFAATSVEDPRQGAAAGSQAWCVTHRSAVLSISRGSIRTCEYVSAVTTLDRCPTRSPISAQLRPCLWRSEIRRWRSPCGEKWGTPALVRCGRPQHCSQAICGGRQPLRRLRSPHDSAREGLHARGRALRRRARSRQARNTRTRRGHR